MLAGKLLKATPALKGDFFEDVVILLVEHDQQGAVGFIINRPDGRLLNQLEFYKAAPPIPFYVGGPVDQEHIYVIHRRPDLIAGGTRIPDGRYYGGSFPDVLTAISSGRAGMDDVQLYLGYCGWDAGELEAELEEGSWELVSDLQGPHLQGPHLQGPSA